VELTWYLLTVVGQLRRLVIGLFGVHAPPERLSLVQVARL
jgi:hypothetical protein